MNIRGRRFAVPRFDVRVLAHAAEDGLHGDIRDARDDQMGFFDIGCAYSNRPEPPRKRGINSSFGILEDGTVAWRHAKIAGGA